MVVASFIFLFLAHRAHGAADASNQSVGGLGPECQNYLHKKGFANADQLAGHIHRCAPNPQKQGEFAPDPRPRIPGSTDTTDLSCRYGNPYMRDGTTCCGLKPHFNWIVSTCERKDPFIGQFCSKVPSCALDGSPKINYVAAYQFDGEKFVLMDESSAGDINSAGISGNWNSKTGWEKHKHDFGWKGGDWTTKYAPWGKGASGPRGVTPPAGMWVLSAENFYYAGFYMLSQLNLNMAGNNMPYGENCWLWELDPLEGASGWTRDGHTPGSLNQLYSTDNAQSSGCMPTTYYASQVQGGRSQHQFKFPEEFQGYCKANPEAIGCSAWQSNEDVSWSGGSTGSQRFENLWDEPYVFVIVVDAKGYWTYRWRPAALGDKTGWEGITRYSAARTVPARPTPIKDQEGLKADVKGDVVEAVILQPSLSTEGSCSRSSLEAVNWQFGANALGAVAEQLGENGPGGRYEGAHNWWTHFHDTQQYASYPLSIAGVPRSHLAPPTCNTKQSFSCSCGGKAPPHPSPGPSPHPVPPPSPPPAPPPAPHNPTTCNNKCNEGWQIHTCRERVDWAKDNQKVNNVPIGVCAAMNEVNGQCHGQCYCKDYDFGAHCPTAAESADAVLV